jgi:hypothetical protein
MVQAGRRKPNLKILWFKQREESPTKKNYGASRQKKARRKNIMVQTGRRKPD